METAHQVAAPQAAGLPAIRWRNLWWVALALAVMVAAVLSRMLWFLNFVHVFSSILWTGTDIFMGFMLGPIMRRVEFPVRRAIIGHLMPRMLFYMPTLSIITGTSGYYLANQMGFLDAGFPQRWWLIAAAVLMLAMTVQGIGLILPTNLRVYFELRKERPDPEKIQQQMRFYLWLVAAQGLMQVAMILVMARFASGL